MTKNTITYPRFDIRRRLGAVLGLLTLLGAGTASAQVEQIPPGRSDVMEIATDDPSQEIVYHDAPPHHHSGYVDRTDEGVGLRFGGGRAFTNGVSDGWFGRLELDVYTHYTKGSGGTVVSIGGEGWSAEDAGGGGMPVVSGFALESGPLFASMGFGFEVFIVDKVHGETGWGLFAPLAAISFGLNFDGFRILADGRGIYRWQFGSDDRSQGLVGLSLEFPL